MMLTELHSTIRRRLNSGCEPVFGQEFGKHRCSLGCRRARHGSGVSTLCDAQSLFGIFGHKFALWLRCHEAKGSESDVVVHLVKGIAPSSRQREHLRRSPATARRRRSRPERCFLVGAHERGTFKGIEMPPNGSGRQRELGGQLRCTRRTALKQTTRDTSGGTSDFHNVIVT